MDVLRQDVLFAIRSLIRTPGITLAALVCLALGMGATTTTYTATRALVLSPVPAVDADRLMRLSELPPSASEDADGVSPATFLDWEREATAFSGLAAYRWWNVNVTGGDEPERVTGFRVTPRFFALLGERALAGRTLRESDASAQRLVVLSYPLWQRRFGGAASAIGTSILLNGSAHTIIGVMGPDFIFPPGAELWATLSFSPEEAADRGIANLSVMGRLRDGVAPAAARAEIAALQTRIAEAAPAQRRGWESVVEPVQVWYSRNPRPFVLMLLGGVSLVLLIACGNVANLLLAKATSREREVAVRLALGAGRRRIVRQLMTESLVLALAAGTAGVLLALWGVLVFRNAIPSELVRFNPGWTRIRVDLPALLISMLVSLITAFVFGLAPALQATRPRMLVTLRDAGRGATATARSRLRNGLVIAEIALALTLVAATGLMLRSFIALLNADLGFDRADLLSMTLTLPEQSYPDAERISGFYVQLEQRLAALPVVKSAAATSVLPMDYEDTGVRVQREQDAGVAEGELPVVRLRVVTPGYFHTLAVPLIAGRSFTEYDHAAAPRVAVVSQLLARRFWPGENAVGKRLRVAGQGEPVEVIGVVQDIRHNPNASRSVLQPTLHLPHAQAGNRNMTVLLRGAAEVAAVAAAARNVVDTLDPTLAPGEVYTMDRTIANALAPQRTTAGTLAVFGVIAVVLACVGVYGVMSYTVRRRADEIGVRMALGARGEDIARLVLRQGGRLVALGLVFGLAGALILSRTMRALIHEIRVSDPTTFVGSTLVLAAVAVLACWIPARRAARHDPAQSLRYE